jgi:PmbA protein
MSLLAEGKHLLSAIKPPAGVQTELFLTEGRSRQVAWGEGKPKDVLSSVSAGMSVRVIERGRQGFAFANEASPERARQLFDQARASAALMPLDKRRRLASKAAAAPLKLPFDRRLFQMPVKSLQSRLAGHEDFLLKADPRIKKALSLSFHEGEGAHAIVTTRGVAVEDRSTSVSFSLEIMGEDGGETQVAWDWTDALTWSALDVSVPLNGARERLLRSFGAKPVPSGAYAVIFPPRVGVDVLSLAASALSAEAVQKGRSFLAGKRGRAVASPLVTLVDDGRLPSGPASGRFDDEGVPARRNLLVSKGVLKGYYYDAYTAAKEGRKSTGNAGRPGIKGPPSPEPTNFFLAAGRTPLKDLMAGTPRAFIVQDLLGMHTADPVTGDFSVGAAGLLWENGAVSRAVKGVTLAGSLPDLLRKVDAVADDLTWLGATGAPTFRVSSLSIGGS